MNTPPPVCPQLTCGARFHTQLRLDQHLRFECPALGRRRHFDDPEADEIATALDDFHHELASAEHH